MALSKGYKAANQLATGLSCQGIVWGANLPFVSVYINTSYSFARSALYYHGYKNLVQILGGGGGRIIMVLSVMVIAKLIWFRSWGGGGGGDHPPCPLHNYGHGCVHDR